MKVSLLDLQAQYRPLRDEIRKVMDEVCDTQALILGPHVEKFEKHLAEYCGTKHAIGLSSGTDALLCALMAIGIKPGDEVICPTFTFFATAGSIARLGAKPVFVDIEPGSFNIDANLIERAITPRTRAIMPVHLFGQMAKMEAINEIACHHDLLTIEDAAQAIGSSRNGKKACAHGFVGSLSFYPTKNLGAFGDAGAICCNDDKVADTVRKLRVHGSGHTYYHEMIGGMFRLAALQAAVLDVKLKHLDDWHAARRKNAALYNELLRGTKVVTPPIDQGNESIYNQYVVRVADRDAVKRKLTDANIGSAIYYPLSLHEQTCFQYLGYKKGDFPESERACREVLALPVYPELPEEHLRYVVKVLKEATA